MQHREEVAEDVRLSVAAMRATFQVVDRWLRQLPIALLEPTTSGGCSREVLHLDRLALKQLPLSVQARCSLVREAPTLGSHYLASRVRTLVHPAEQIHHQFRKRRKTRRTRTLQRILSGKILIVSRLRVWTLIKSSALASLDSSEAVDNASPAGSPPTSKLQPANAQRSKSPLGKEKADGEGTS